MTKDSPVVLRRFGPQTPADKRKPQKLSLKTLTSKGKVQEDKENVPSSPLSTRLKSVSEQVQKLLDEDTPPPLIKRLPTGLSSTARRRICQPSALFSSDEDSPVQKKPGRRKKNQDASPLLLPQPIHSSRFIHRSPLKPLSSNPPGSPDYVKHLESPFKPRLKPSHYSPPTSPYKPPSRTPQHKPTTKPLDKSPSKPTSSAYRSPPNSPTKLPLKSSSHSDSSDDEVFEAFLKDLKNKKSKKNGKESSEEDDDYIVVSDDEESDEGEKTFIHAAVPPSAFDRKEESSSSSEIEEWKEPELKTPPPLKPLVRPKKQPPPRTTSSKPSVTQDRIPSVTQVSNHHHKSFLSSLSTTVDLAQCHPDAKPYRTNFKKKKEELTAKLFHLFNERVFQNKLPSDFSVTWNVRLRKTAGICINTRMLSNWKSRVELSTKILDSPDRLRDTLIHELCHAATWMVSKQQDHHGPYWRAWAMRAVHAFPELPPINRCHTYTINTKFVYKCTKCGGKIGRHSKSVDVQKKVCGRCRGKLVLWMANGKPVKQPVANTTSSLNNAFDRLKI